MARGHSRSGAVQRLAPIGGLTAGRPHSPHGKRLMRAMKILTPALPVLLALGSSVAAHHPGDKLDEVMNGQEEIFQTIDRPAPAFARVDAARHPAAPSDFPTRVGVVDLL